MESTKTQTHQPQQPAQTVVIYNEFVQSRLTPASVEKKVVPGTGANAKPPTPEQNYYQIPLMYNFGTENKILSDFMLEGCEMATSSGIQSKPNVSNRVEYSLMCKLDTNNVENNRFIETLNQVHLGCAGLLASVKGQVKMPHFDAKMAEATGLRSLVFRARDEASGDIIEGRAPSMFLKLFSRGKAPLVEQTLFTGLDGKPIPWILLQGVEMKFIPLLHIKRIYVGSKASIQMEVVSAIVTFIRSRNTATKQTDTLHRLQQSHPEMMDDVASQIAKLTVERQDQLIPAQQPSQQVENKLKPDQPTFIGIGSSTPDINSILANPPQRNLPTTPTLTFN